MGFDSGSVSFRRFAVAGAAARMPEQELLDRLAAYTLQPSEFGVPEEVEYGWCGGRHILDASFTFEHNVFADAVSFAMRIDTNMVPGELKKAYQMMEEEAVAQQNPSGFISKGQKREVKDSVRRKLDDELRSGRFRKSKMLSMLWDLPSATLYCSCTPQQQEMLMELFERTFELKLLPLSAGSIALRTLEARGQRRDYEDFKPSRFAYGPEGESQQPDYPWVAKGPEAKDFLGNEFLLWLWHHADARENPIEIEGGDATVMIDRTLDLECAYGATGKDTLRAAGPSRMPEALDALRSGKVPRKAGLIVESAGIAYNLNFNSESFAVGSLVLPEVEEADSPRVLFEERVAMLRSFCKTLDGLYNAFLGVRAGGAWSSHATAIRKWAQQSAKTAAPVVAVA